METVLVTDGCTLCAKVDSVACLFMWWCDLAFMLPDSDWPVQLLSLAWFFYHFNISVLHPNSIHLDPEVGSRFLLNV
jgi:hypothetical protein